MVCFAPMGRAPARYALAPTPCAPKSCLGISLMACSTRSSFTPRAAMWRSTISARWCASPRSCSSFRGVVAKHVLERLEPVARFVRRGTEMQRGKGAVAVLHGVEVGALAGMPDGRLAADPVVLPAAGVEPLDHAFRVCALAERRDLHTAKFAE